MKSPKKKRIEDTIFEKNSVPTLKGKKTRNVIQLILALGINGPSTITEAAIFLISSQMIKKTKIKMTPDVRIKSAEFKQIISDRKYPTDRNLDPLPGLETEGYVTKIGKKTAGNNPHTSVYCLTNKGQLLFLGIKEDSSIKLKVSTDKLEKFIRNSAKTNLYFAYVSDMIEHISLELVIQIFIKPIRDMLERLPVFRDDDVGLFIPNFSMAVGLEYANAIRHSALEYYIGNSTSFSMVNDPKLSRLEKIKKRTLITSKLGMDWKEFLIEKFYKKHDREFYKKYSSVLDGDLLMLVMEQIVKFYFIGHGYEVPTKSGGRTLHSRAWIRSMKEQKSIFASYGKSSSSRQ